MPHCVLSCDVKTNFKNDHKKKEKAEKTLSVIIPRTPTLN